ncbi:DNA-binding transcriptional regulator, LysR family [Pustulibacterium marinum]|uniref:DNA-binding transcriptional regulator, LysR family n=1 Tax=Pustulibacterium marinum TaxID=1224947 RepID=A0A1I7F3R5_9FLAO|nr:LysR substrate-binding domain-containing protein [Pustulibacterium marinum]SFU30858.1 DNA-binding transcriptional regulator, LysR family [Pustulibacterium marinum]
MFDFRLKVFYTVAKHLNFTRAARELFITQPAVTKHIKEIENHFNTKLFHRNGTYISLTASGEILLKYAEEIFDTYRKLEIDIHAQQNKHAGTLRLGASTTIANYVLPLVLPDFQREYPDINLQLHIGNTEQIEKSLQNKEIDLGITEGFSKAAGLQYQEFLKDEIVLIVNTANPLGEKAIISLEELQQLPLLIREPGSGTLEVIAHALVEKSMKISQLKTLMQLSSSESMKQYILNSDSLAFLSIYAVLNELKQKTVTILEVENLTIERNFYFVTNQAEMNYLVRLFTEFSSSYNFR